LSGLLFATTTMSIEHRPKRGRPTHIEDYQYLRSPAPNASPYIALFCNSTKRILVVDVDSAKQIYRGGFYGKGTLSRSGPAFSSASSSVQELLQLTPEEAFYLMSSQYGLGVLVVASVDDASAYIGKTPSQDHYMSEEAFWKLLCSLDSAFPLRFATYYKCRTFGWVVRSGLKFASDYMIYRKGPAFYHAAFSVRWFASDNEDNPMPGSWRDILAWNRVTGAVSKQQLLVNVSPNEEPSNDEDRDPKQFKIRSLSIKRWVPQANRD
jgi:tRNA splicing endonuclease